MSKLENLASDGSELKQAAFGKIPQGCIFYYDGRTFEKRSSRTGLDHEHCYGTEWFAKDQTCYVTESALKAVADFQEEIND